MSPKPPKIIPSIGVNLRVTGHCNQGGRKYMEDMFSVAYKQTPNKMDLEYAYFAIFDGHGGGEAAHFAKTHLMRNIVFQPEFWSDDDEIVCQSIKAGFIHTHHDMWTVLSTWPKTVSGLPSTSGTTASIAFIRKAKAYIAHVGDSGIVVGRQLGSGVDPDESWVAEALTVDHKPETPAEFERIKRTGGMVMSKSGVPRVVWQRPNPLHTGPHTRSSQMDQIPFLAVARSLGDLWSYNPSVDDFVVSPHPDVLVLPIDLTKDRCIILGTDGLFNMLSPQEAVDTVERAERNNKLTYDGEDIPWINPSKYLVDHAVSKWTNSRLRADNTSAVVLLLDPLARPQYARNSFPTLKETEGCQLTSSIPSTSAVCQTWPPRVGGQRMPSHQICSLASSMPSSPSNDITRAAQAWRKKALKMVRKRKSCERVVRRNRSVCSDSFPIRQTKPIRTRRTRSEEPNRKQARQQSNAENGHSRMKLRSSATFRTLRSRSINLDKSTQFGIGEPRSKRIRK